MARDLMGFDTITLRGDPVSRAMAALSVARYQVRSARYMVSCRLEAILSEIDSAMAVHLRRLEDEIEDDAADAEVSVDDSANRQAWLHLRKS